VLGTGSFLDSSNRSLSAPFAKKTDRAIFAGVSKGERTREQIIHRAFQQAHHVGLEGLSLGVLAADLELSKSGLFAHFASKEQLQLEVVAELVHRFTAAIVAPALRKQAGEPRIKALFENYLAWVREHDGQRGCLLTAMLYEYADRPGVIRDKLLEADRQWFEVLERACGVAKREKHFKAGVDAAQFAYEWLGIHMVFQQALRFFDDPQAEKRANTAFKSLLARSHR
jgi:AcrR family transcriptional regulator